MSILQDFEQLQTFKNQTSPFFVCRLFGCHTDDKDPTHQNQEWSLNSNGTITSTMSGMCIDAQDFGKTDGTNVQLWSCSGNDNQKWSHDSADGTIRGVQSGLCLDVGSKASCMDRPWSGYPYCDDKLDAKTRAEDLVSRLTLAEKVRALFHPASSHKISHLLFLISIRDESVHGNLLVSFPGLQPSFCRLQYEKRNFFTLCEKKLWSGAWE